MLTKIFTAVRAAGHETGEAVVNQQALRILAQEIRDAEATLRTSTQELVAVMARRKAETRSREAVEKSITDGEAQARAAAEAGEAERALEIAKRVVDLNRRRDGHDDSLRAMNDYIDRMRQSLDEAEGRIAEMKQELSFAKARDAMQRIDGRIRKDCRNSRNALGEAEETLQRVKSLQQQREDELAACAELSAGRAQSPARAEASDRRAARDDAARELLRRITAPTPDQSNTNGNTNEGDDR